MAIIIQKTVGDWRKLRKPLRPMEIHREQLERVGDWRRLRRLERLRRPMEMYIKRENSGRQLETKETGETIGTTGDTQK